MQPERLPLAAEGYPFIGFAALTTLTLAVLGMAVPALVALTLTAFVSWFFRDPVRHPPDVTNAVVSPADGKIILVEEIFDDRFLHEQVFKVSIFMNVFNVHVNRMPLAGTVQAVHLKPGRFYAADHNKAALHNEYCAMTVTTDNGQRYCAVQVAGLIARRIVCRAEPGDTLDTGERYGLIRFGSRVDLYLPRSTRVDVRQGQIVSAGETIIGQLP
ncbi:MAG: phosphatidylserine decarboxylase family protein [Desulfobulbus propionicus]|nr:MAG: phosphatidylserine decarboxylase family protein [Desulfobulbus propionicus]